MRNTMMTAVNRTLYRSLLICCVLAASAATAIAGTATLTWNAPTTNTDGSPVTNLAGYKVYYGTAPSKYGTPIDIGKATTYQDNALTDGLTYYFSVTAYNTSGLESSFSNEASKAIPFTAYTLTTTRSGAGTGSITSSPAGITCGATCSAQYPAGTIVTLTAVPDAGAIFAGWSGACTGTGTCTVTMDAAKTASAAFNLRTYTLTASAGANGGISPAGTVSAPYGANLTFTITPVAGYHVADVLVDGVSAGAVSTYTFTNVTATHTIAASFAVNTATITVTATAGSGGTISPSTRLVTYNTTTTFQVTPNAGYTATAGGTCGGTLIGSTYTTNAVTAPCTISVAFTPGPPVLWYNTTSGMVYGMTTDGAKITGGAIIHTEPDTTWSIVGQGDFDGDGIRDYVWWNSGSGQVYLMHMASATTIKDWALIYQDTNTHWNIVATGDINNDTKTDLIWQNDQTGQVYAMLINNSTVTGGAVIYTETDLDWKIVGTGDFSGTGRADLLYWNSGTGQTAIVRTAGLNPASGTLIYTEPDTNWKLAGIGDLDGDGKADIVWHNKSTGKVYGMLMNDTSIANSAVIYTEPNTHWEIASIDKYAAGNKAGLLWKNTATGQVYLMPMNGLSVLAGSLLYTEPDLAWCVEGATEWRDNLYGPGITTTTPY